MESIYFSEEHGLFRETLRRFINEEVIPYGDQWEDAGEIPREVLRKMGTLGFLSLMPRRMVQPDLLRIPCLNHRPSTSRALAADST